MLANLKEFKEYISETWSEVTWIRAAGILTGLIAGLLSINSALPKGLALDITKLNSDQKCIIFASVLILYFFLVSVFSGDRVRFEKKLRSLEQSFKYDNRGTLFNGSEPNIAFRIATFHGILEGISSTLDSEKMNNALFQTGRDASSDFGHKIGTIYNDDVAAKKVKKTWEDLTLKEKLDQWAEYDSATGWGILSSTINNHKVKVVINHIHDLFNLKGGELFGQFLAGYSENIISMIVDEHQGGKYQEYDGAKLEKVNHIDKYTLELEYKLR